MKLVRQAVAVQQLEVEELRLAAGDRADESDAARLAGEAQLLVQLRQLLAKLQPLAGSIDGDEAAAVAHLVEGAQQRGEFRPAELASVVIAIEGNAVGVPDEYIARALEAQIMVSQIDDDIEQLATAIIEEGTGASDAAAIRQLQELVAAREDVNDKLYQNYELSKQDPAAALTQLEQALAA